MSNLFLRHIYKIYPGTGNAKKNAKGEAKKRSGDFVAVKDFNMEINDGEFIVFVGPSGCGKSTTLRMIAGLEDISSGTIEIDGQVVNDLEPRDRDIAMVFQNYAIFPHLSVRENVMFGLNLKKGMTDAEREEIALKYIKMVGLEKFINAYPKELSGGMKQRVAIARAYAVNPSLLLMDEPFGALDAQTRTQLQTELLKTWEEEKKTCFFITHDVEEAILLASRVVVMSARPGRIKEVIDIDIPYPRNQETKMLPRFTELKNYIWQNVYKEYLEVQK